MKTFLSHSVIILVFIISSCHKGGNDVPAIVAPLNDSSLPSGAVSSVQVTDKSSGQLTVAMDVFVFRDSKNIETQLQPADFLNDTVTDGNVSYYYALQKADNVKGKAPVGYSALMLMDQSGSIHTTDPQNYRIDAARTFCTHLGAADNVMLWSFAGSSMYYTSDLVQYGSGFTSDSSVLIPYIESLSGKANGSTPLYNSQYSVVDYAAAHASSANKAVMTFTDGQNTENGRSSGDVIQDAIAKNIRLFNVGLSGAEIEELSHQSFATGGAFMYAQNARQLISMFGNLGSLLNGTGSYYHTVWIVSRSAGSFTSGTLHQTITIKLPYGGQVKVPCSFTY